MDFLLNVIFAVLGYLAANYLLAKGGVADPIKLIVAVLVGVVVYLANFAAHVV